MECDLFSKFPSGGSWWSIQHPAHTQWKQHAYETPFSSPIQNVVHEEPKHKQKDYTFPRKHEVAIRMVPLIEYMLDAIDPCASLYTPSQKADAVQYMRQRFFDFVTSQAHTYFGPKKSRILAVWLSGNSCKQESHAVIVDFVSFMLGDQARRWELILNRKGTWMKKI